MVLLECAPPFQWRPSYVRFGDFRRVMWLWFAVTHYSAGGVNELFEGIARAAVSIHEDDKAAAA
jgi:hypothetical protein